MALKSTVYKAQLAIADMDRALYADHALTLARHPSETDERLMVRLLAFALHVPADDRRGRLEMARGLSDTDEPDLWQHDLGGALVHWIEAGQPDERRLLKACGRAERVTVLAYSAAVPLWWAPLAPGGALRQPRGLAAAQRAVEGTGRAGAAFDAVAGDGAGRLGVGRRRGALGRAGARATAAARRRAAVTPAAGRCVRSRRPWAWRWRCRGAA